MPYRILSNFTSLETVYNALVSFLERPLNDKERFYIAAERVKLFFCTTLCISSSVKHLKSEPKRAFQAKGRRTILDEFNFSEVKSGDHLAWHRPWIYWHHAIVLKVDKIQHKCLVIHWNKLKGSLKMVQEWIHPLHESGLCYRIDYEDEVNENNPQALVVYRALCVIRTAYNLFKNNCESFATFCKTCTSESCQVGWLRGKVKETETVCGILIGAELGKRVATVILKEVETKTTSEWLIKQLRMCSSTDFLRIVSIRTVECAFMLTDIHTIYERWQNGLIPNEDFIITAIQRFCEGLFGAGLLYVYGPGIAQHFETIGRSIGSPMDCSEICALVGYFFGIAVGGFLCGMKGRAHGAFIGPFVGKGIANVTRRGPFYYCIKCLDCILHVNRTLKMFNF